MRYWDTDKLDFVELKGKDIATDIMVANLDLDTLHTLWDTALDQAYQRNLDSLIQEAYAQVLEYFVDGIDEAADDENQTILKRKVAGALFDLTYEIEAYDDLPTPTQG